MNKHPQVIHIETIEPKEHPCDLCGKGKFKGLDLRVGGFINYGHDECCAIAEEGIKRFFQLIVHHPNGTNILAEQLLKARGARFHLNDLFE